MAVWTTEYIDNLPDSSFLYIEDGGKKDADGKTMPRSLRHFPVKDAQGNVDADHVRNALARIPQSNVPAEAKAEATRKAQALLKEIDSDSDGDSGSSDNDSDGRSESPPRDLLVRTSLPFEIIRSASDTGMPVLHGRGAAYNEWTEINSRVEGHFMERFAPGSFTKTINEQRDRIRCLFNHGQDPSIGMKPLGPITSLEERDDGVHYEVQMLNTDYCRSLVPGLEANLYGSSFLFGTIKKDDQRRNVTNTKGILERTIKEAYMRELGPTPFPQYGGTTAAVRSLTDEFVLGRFPASELAAQAALRSEDRDLVGEMKELARVFVESSDTDEDAMRGIIAILDEITGSTTAHTEEDAARTGTSRPSAATTPSTAPLWGMNRDEEEAPPWRL